MRRLAVLDVSLEANTFASRKTTALYLAEPGRVSRGQDLVERYGNSATTIGGFLDPDLPSGIELVPLISFHPGANGQFTADAFDLIVSTVVETLRDNGPFDGVLMGLHGAAVAENCEHADAVIARHVRSTVGVDVPIGVVLDMHCNLDLALVEAVDVLRVYQTTPHVDAKEQALECRALVIEIVTGETSRPVTAFQPLPMIINIVKQDTSLEPLAGILQECRELEMSPGMLDVSICEGFPYADVEQMGVSVIASHRRDPGAARVAADKIAGLLWAARDAFQGTGLTAEQALRTLASHRSGSPTMLLDVGDNAGGGSRGDSTTILNEAIRLGVGGLLMSLWDPQTVASLAAVDVGSWVEVKVGGRSPDQEGYPQPLSAVLIARSDGRYEDPGTVHGGFRHFDAGPTVALRMHSGNVIVLTTRSTSTRSPEQFRSLGIEPSDFLGIVAKCVNSPRAGFGSICGRWLMVDTPGVTRLSVDEFPYRRRSTPMYPFELDTVYTPGAAVTVR